MDPVLRALLLERLKGADPEVVRVISEAAAAEAPGSAPPPVWLRSVTVEGFRGIGPPATLALEPSPGLTVVVGRNGSGKSSFAEGLELLMTGGLKRWEGRPKAWRETWQCLHHDGPTRLSAELLLEGSGATVALAQEWAHGAAFDDAGPPAVLAEHGWARALGAYRPFLAYAELATMFDTLTSLYDALTPVLGLADLDALLQRLGAERLALDNQRKAVAAERTALLARLEPGDELAAALGDLDAVEALLDAAPSLGEDAPELRRLAGLVVPSEEEILAAVQALDETERAHADAAATDAARATKLATLLRRALDVRDGADCPVCGTPGVLDEAWAEHAAAQAGELERQAAALTAAEGALAIARRRVDALPATTVEEAADLRARSDAANAELARRGAAWQEQAVQVRGWLTRARDSQAQAATLKALKAAEKWVKEAAAELRAERFAPISERAIANWRELRQGSSVDLHEITLKKVGRGGRADFDVRADGEGANALGVMSQGELLALSVSVFLPRAALDESPFRFAVIDDPVQAMDPTKVDGLARVLHQAARTRQIVVFTHDDRLPEAIRRLRLDATTLHVDRRARSSVDVQVSPAPFQRYLKSARDYTKPDRVPPEVQARVVPMFCRQAVEAAAATVVRRRAVETGSSLADADEQLAEARSLRETLAVVLFSDAGRQSEVASEVSRRFGAPAAGLVSALNRGAHGNPLDPQTLVRLPDGTRDLIHDLMA